MRKDLWGIVLFLAGVALQRYYTLFEGLEAWEVIAYEVVALCAVAAGIGMSAWAGIMDIKGRPASTVSRG